MNWLFAQHASIAQSRQFSTMFCIYLHIFRPYIYGFTCHPSFNPIQQLGYAVQQLTYGLYWLTYISSLCMGLLLIPPPSFYSIQVVFAGMMVSSGIWGKICDKYGRKVELLLCSSFTFYYGVLSALSPNWVWMLILRGLVGFGIGGVPQS